MSSTMYRRTTTTSTLSHHHLPVYTNQRRPSSYIPTSPNAQKRAPTHNKTVSSIIFRLSLLVLSALFAYNRKAISKALLDRPNDANGDVGTIGGVISPALLDRRNNLKSYIVSGRVISEEQRDERNGQEIDGGSDSGVISLSLQEKRNGSEPDTRRTYSDNTDYCIRNSSAEKCCDASHCGLVQKSTLHLDCCNTTATKVWPILITSTPRSGTNFVCQILQSLDVDVEYDWANPREDGLVSWMHIFPGVHDHYLSKGKLHGGRFSTVIHLVRDPLETITSIAFTEPVLGPGYQFYLRHFIPLVNEDRKSKELIAMQFFIGWHQFIDSLHVPRIRLEDIDADTILEVFRLAGFETTPRRDDVEEVLRDKRHPINARKHRAILSWKELCDVDRDMTRQFWELSRRFGYYMETSPPCSS